MTERLPFTAATRRLRAWGVALCCALPLLASAQAPGQDLQAVSDAWLQQALGEGMQQGQMPLRMEVQVGRLDPRLNLAPCQRVEPYVPAGSKLWGRTRIGLRCVEGPKAWNVFMPVTVKAWGPAWVLTHNVGLGETLRLEDALQSEVDWAAETSPVVVLPEDWVGQTAARVLVAGQALRQSMVRPGQLFKSGATVKVLVNGGGFVVTSSGKAMTGGGPGQEVRVRMDNGRFVTGTVNAQGDVVVAQ